MKNIDLAPDRTDYTPKGYREFIKREIRPYIDEFLTFEDFVILYSGPSKYLRNESGIADIKSNNGLSAQMLDDIKKSEKVSGSRINDTEAAHALERHALNAYFQDYLESNNPHIDFRDPLNAELIEALRDEIYAEVWGGISELFVQRDFRHAASAVCGADAERVFVRDELPTLVKTDHLKTINGIRCEAVKRVYNEVSPDEAFRLVCLSEINFVLSRSVISKQGASAVMSDANKRIEYYNFERDETYKAVGDLSGEQKSKLSDIISEFKLNALYETKPETWGRAVKKPMRLSLLVAKPVLTAAAA